VKTYPVNEISPGTAIPGLNHGSLISTCSWKEQDGKYPSYAPRSSESLVQPEAKGGRMSAAHPSGTSGAIPRDRFKGVPPGLLCDISEVKKELNIKDEAWTRLMKAGFPVLVKVGGVSIGWTTEVVEWMKSRPELQPLPSTLRTRRRRARQNAR
jgi:predicted DNA-binding transcriptional regulator AlpA